jgi:hypothetical protein
MEREDSLTGHVLQFSGGRTCCTFDSPHLQTPVNIEFYGPWSDLSAVTRLVRTAQTRKNIGLLLPLSIFRPKNGFRTQIQL